MGVELSQKNVTRIVIGVKLKDFKEVMSCLPQCRECELFVSCNTLRLWWKLQTPSQKKGVQVHKLGTLIVIEFNNYFW